MTTPREPPRLRTLRADLPEELSLALEESAGDVPTEAELALLHSRLRSARSDFPAEPRQPRSRLGRPALRGRAASLVLMFTFGAGAGVLASGGIFVVTRMRAADSAEHVAPFTSAPDERAASAASVAASASPAPSLREPALPPAGPLPEPIRKRGSDSEQPRAEPEVSPSRPFGASREELALLARAQAALTGNPGLALALTSDHERKFPSGALVQEREVVAVDALLRLGRRAEAGRRALRFRQEFPASVHGRRLDVLLRSSSPADSAHN